MEKVSVVGAAAVGDYIFHVDKLPEPGEIVRIKNLEPEIRMGGCAPNISMDIHSLGLARETLFYPVGDEDYGLCLEKWQAAGIDCRLTKGKGPSGKAWLYIQDDGSTMCFAYPGVADVSSWSSSSELDDIVVVCPVLNDFTKGCIRQCIEEGRELVVTGIATSSLVEFLPSVRCLSVNVYEFESLCGSLGVDKARFLELYPDLILIITEGSKGSTISLGEETWTIPAIAPDCIVDTTGAGDAYIAGFVSGLASGLDLECCGFLGASLSSFSLERAGGQNPLPDFGAVTDRIGLTNPEIKERILKRGLI